MTEVLSWKHRCEDLYRHQLDEDGEWQLEEFLSDEEAVSPLDSVMHDDLHKRVMQVLASLSPLEEKVIRARFGISELREYTQKEVGQDIGVSISRIGQIEKKALRKLRHPRWSRMLRPFVFGGRSGQEENLRIRARLSDITWHDELHYYRRCLPDSGPSYKMIIGTDQRNQRWLDDSGARLVGPFNCSADILDYVKTAAQDRGACLYARAVIALPAS